jgi:phage N-6-adenine-methyltransferase
MNNELMFSSATAEWYTEDDPFAYLNDYYRFTLDPTATAENAKCKKFYTKKDSGLVHSWAGERVFMNPPYGEPETACKFNQTATKAMPIVNAAGEQVNSTNTACSKKKCAQRGYHVSEYIPGIIDFMKKAYDERKNAEVIVCLVPSRTDTQWFHRYAYRKANLDFFEGRLKFGGCAKAAPFPSLLVTYGRLSLIPYLPLNEIEARYATK